MRDGCKSCATTASVRASCMIGALEAWGFMVGQHTNACAPWSPDVLMASCRCGATHDSCQLRLPACVLTAIWAVLGVMAGAAGHGWLGSVHASVTAALWQLLSLPSAATVHPLVAREASRYPRWLRRLPQNQPANLLWDSATAEAPACSQLGLTWSSDQ